MDFGKALERLSLGIALALGVIVSDAGAQEGQDTVYRVTVVRGATEADARDLQFQLESGEFIPTYLRFRGDRVDLLYGNFPSQEAAVEAKGRLTAAGWEPQEILAVQRGSEASPALAAVGDEIAYMVVVQEFFDIRRAELHKDLLEKDGFFDVGIQQLEGVMQVTVGGRYADMGRAQNQLSALRNKNYNLSKVVQAGQMAGSASRPASGAGDQGVTLSPAITQTELWQSFSPEQQKKLLNMVAITDEIRSGNEVAQRVLNLEKLLESLTGKMRLAFDIIEEDRREEAEKKFEINRLFSEAQSLANGKRYADAILKLKKILTLDPAHQPSQTRLRIFAGYMRGESYEGQAEEIQEKYRQLAEAAELAENSGQPDSLILARGYWQDIKQLDPDKFGEEADEAIGRINQTLVVKREEERTVDAAAVESRRLLWMALIGAIGMLFVLMLVLWAVQWIRSNKRHRQLITSIHEITSGVRPMRQLEPAAAGGGALPGGAAIPAPEESEDDLFAPSADMPGDPLGEAGPKPVAEESPPSDEGPGDIFGEDSAPEVGSAPETSAEVSAGLEDPFGQAMDTETSKLGTDDIFGVEEGKAEPVPAASDEDSGFDAVFSDLPNLDDTNTGVASGGDGETSVLGDTADAFSMEDIFGAEEEKPKRKEVRKDDEMSAISFGDILGEDSGGEKPAAETVPPTQNELIQRKPKVSLQADSGEPKLAAPADDPLSIFDESPTGQSTPAPKAAAPAADQPTRQQGGGDDPFEGTPFASIFGEDSTTSSGESTGGASESVGAGTADSGVMPSGAESTGMGDDTEIPAIKLDLPGDDPFANLSVEAEETSDEPESPRSAETMAAGSGGGPVPASGHSTTAIPEMPGQDGVIFFQNFEQDAVGQKPSNWSGDYDFASLLVESESPPKGAKHYLAYRKAEGKGKVYYCAKFPNTSGTLSVEFDLRCNMKNEFLLGFYIEKDENFQESVKTKILRSEAQTAPTIHIQQEPAPYFLGSWAHIKYVINLGEGKVDGYIDGTHIARGVRLPPQVPKYLNTLAIRDNVKTTGDLFIANIEVKKLA